MLNYIRKYKLLYWSPIILLILGALVAVPLLNSAHIDLPMSDTAGALLLCLFIILWAGFCHRLANKSFMKRISLLNDQCDPESFLKANEHSYKKAIKARLRIRPRRRAAAFIQNYHSVALISAGRYEEAFKATELLSMRTRNSAGCTDFYAICFTCNASALIWRNADGDIAAARECIEKVKEMSGKYYNNSGEIANEVTRLEYRLDAAEGKNLQGCLEYFTRQADNASCVRAEAAYRSEMAFICRQLGDTENERAQLEIVAQKAPKMHLGKQAAERLAELSAQ